MIDYPKVSVVTITYGHENYIKQTLDGVFMQDYPGEIEFIIANDHSPDATGEIVKQYLSSRVIPDNFTIKYNQHEVNKGMMSNFIWALEQASGKYIALCEGDDYWIDPLKLQQQVDFLEKNIEYVLCFTNRDILRNNVIEISKPLHEKKSFVKAEIASTKITTLTIVFRNVMVQLPKEMNNTLIDGSLFLFLSQFGLFYYFDRSMGVYRIHDDGMWNGSSLLTNYNRSVEARLAAWRYLKDIDRPSLADSLVYWFGFKKHEELRNRMYLSLLKSTFLEFYFMLYVQQAAFVRKIKLPVRKALDCDRKSKKF